MDTGNGSDRHRLIWNGGVLELAARRAGVRTAVTLYRDGRRIAEKTGLGRVTLPLPRPAEESAEEDTEEIGPPTVLAVAVPGRLLQAFLLVPRTAGGRDDDGDGKDRDGGPPGSAPEGPEDLPEGLAELVGAATAERHRFEPPPGTLAGRLWAFEHRHPRLWASRHVAAATAKSAAGLLGIAVFFGVLLDRIVEWIFRLIPDVGLPALPLPKVDLPSIPWPDVDLPEPPDVSLPGWAQAILRTAKYWVPILIAVGVAVEEVRRRTKREARAKRDAGPADRDADRDAIGEPGRHMTPAPAVTGQDGGATRSTGDDDRPDAHR
ncbi:hypothetical protein [Thermomonospora catenispora]|uniref:hypothetical protein n=1 Tax=Thermomonospora catenispora TaxID=2493090 RepID=UPI0013759188|nr:hypothetical protein [Thermomonospora catenispora]